MTIESHLRVQVLPDGGVTVAHARRPHQAPLEFTTDEWQQFLDEVRAGLWDARGFCVECGEPFATEEEWDARHNAWDPIDGEVHELCCRRCR